jgi:hypothetical protein
MIPTIKQGMKEKNNDICPYVNNFNTTPDNGYTQFNDIARYSTGYTSLFGTLGFVVETHMLKPFDKRVFATYLFMQENLKYLNKNGEKIKKLQQEYRENIKKQKDFVLSWKIDSTKQTKIEFAGYTATQKPSTFTKKNRLFYDREKPYKKEIPYLAEYKPLLTKKSPKAYIIPRGWSKVIERFKAQNIILQEIQKDTLMNLKVYYIDKTETILQPYESHYVHYNTEITQKPDKILIKKGDFIVYTNQYQNKYILETLEPQAPDSFFTWNFFDIILQQKEGFSDYVFEDLAEEILQNNPKLKIEFENKQKNDKDFAENPSQQLYFIYKNSKYYEKEFKRYPIFRLE